MFPLPDLSHLSLEILALGKADCSLKAVRYLFCWSPCFLKLNAEHVMCVSVSSYRDLIAFYFRLLWYHHSVLCMEHAKYSGSE